jgi:hypothetical protein
MTSVLSFSEEVGLVDSVADEYQQGLANAMQRD